MTQSPSASPCSTSHSTVPWAKSLMSRSTATPQPSIIIPVWPVAHERRRGRRPPGPRAASSSATDILPIAQSRARPSGSPACRARAGGRPRSPSGPAAGGSRRSRVPRAAAAAANSGSSPMNVCSPDRTSSPAAIASRMIARQASGSRPPVGAMPIRRRVGRGPAARGPRPASRRSGCRDRAGTPRRSAPARVESRTATTSSGP